MERGYRHVIAGYARYTGIRLQLSKLWPCKNEKAHTRVVSPSYVQHGDLPRLRLYLIRDDDGRATSLALGFR